MSWIANNWSCDKSLEKQQESIDEKSFEKVVSQTAMLCVYLLDWAK